MKMPSKFCGIFTKVLEGVPPGAWAAEGASAANLQQSSIFYSVSARQAAKINRGDEPISL